MIKNTINFSQIVSATKGFSNYRHRRLNTTGLLLILLFVSLSSQTFSQWMRTQGPEGVAISSLANIDGIIYAGTQTNGIYISTDDGISWTARNTGIETFEVSSIANKPGYIFAGTFGYGVYRSTDDGQTWMPQSNGTNIAVTSLIVNEPYIFAGTIGNAVQRSSDNGVTWTQTFSPDFIDAMCISGNKIFASASYYTYATTDNGDTWFEVTALSGGLIWSYYCEGSTILAGGVNKIYRSTDNGNTFTTINLNFTFSIVNIYSITSVGSELFIATSYDGVYKSTDNGTTWFSANLGMGPKNVRAITGTNSSTLIAGSHYVSMYRSTDLGLSWNKSVSGFPAGTSILSLLTSGTSVFAGTRDGVYRTDDNGNNWMKLAGTNDTTKYCDVWAMCEFEGEIYASMQLYFDAVIYKSADKGENWIRCSGTGLPIGLSFMKGLVASGNNLIAGTDEGIYYSFDKGDSWYQTNVHNSNITGLASSGNFVYAAVPTGYGVYRSVDYGVNWTVSLQSTVDYVEVAAIDNYAFAGAFFGGARYSSNYGSSWFVSNGFPPDASVFALWPVGDGVVIAGTDLAPSWIYASFDNGSYFSPYSEGLGIRASVEAFTVNYPYMFAGTDYNGVWRRLIPGVIPVELTSFTASANNNNVHLSWQTATETNNSGFEILRSTQNDNTGWKNINFVEGHGTTTETHNYSYVDENLNTGRYSYKLVQIDYDGTRNESEIIEIDVNTQPGKYFLSQNYPNPFNPATTLEYSIPGNSYVKLNVFNAIGQEVATLVNEYQEAGNYKVNFDASELSSGIYYYRLQSNHFNQIKKMILLR